MYVCVVHDVLSQRLRKNTVTYGFHSQGLSLREFSWRDEGLLGVCVGPKVGGSVLCKRCTYARIRLQRVCSQGKDKSDVNVMRMVDLMCAMKF